jgi:hypothetical protein
MCRRPSVRAACSNRRSTASIDNRIARTISGNAMTPAAIAAPVQRNRTVAPSQLSRTRPSGPAGAKASRSAQPVTTGGTTSGKWTTPSRRSLPRKRPRASR